MAWNGSIWVAVGEDFGGPGQILYSTDGITWISAIAPALAPIGTILTTYVNDVAWNGSMWIAVGWGASTNHTMAYSYDGDAWYVVTSPPPPLPPPPPPPLSQGKGIAWNGSMWVAVGYGTGTIPLANTIAYSYDGFNWVGIAAGAGFTTNGNRVAWNGSMWLASGFDSGAFQGQTAYSTNGINWTVVNSTKIYEYYGVAYNSLRPNTITFPTNRIVAVGEGTSVGEIYYSSDGISWTAVAAPPFTVTGYGVAWNGLMWIAVGKSASPIAYSYDGIIWLSPSSWSNPFTFSGNGIAWNDSMWVAVGGNSTYNIAHSSDGINWTSVTSPFASIVNGVAWGRTKWIAVGLGATTIASSVDGITWAAVASPFTVQGHGVAWNGSMWVAVGEGTNKIVYSNDDGITWNSVTWTTANQFASKGNCVAWNGSMWVAGGGGSSSNHIAYSTHGINWTIATTAALGLEATSLAWIGTEWVAMGGSDIIHSPDGITWSAAVPSPFTTSGNGVAWNSGKGSVKINGGGGTLSLNAYGPGLSNKLDVVSGQYYNKGFNNFSVSFTPN